MLKEAISKLRISFSKLKANSIKCSNLSNENLKLDIEKSDEGDEWAHTYKKKDEETCKRLIVLVLHSSDLQLNFEGASHSTTSLEKFFRVIYINIDVQEQESILNDLVDTDIDQQHLPLVCVLISPQMSQILQNNTQAWMSCLNSDKWNPFILYDELNEIEMFKLKYRLSRGIKYLQVSLIGGYVHEHILHNSFRVINEKVCQLSGFNSSFISKLHQDSYESVKKNSATFKIFPGKIKQENEKVFISLERNVTSIDQIDVLFNGQSAFQLLKIKQLNPMTIYFTLPGKYYRNGATLSVSLVLNCQTFMGTEEIAFELSSSQPLSKSNLLMSINSVDFLCQSFGVETLEQVDFELSRVFNASLPDFGIYSFLSTSTQINFWLPTWLHFAAYYNLKELTLHLLQTPAAVRACFVRNSEGLMPKEIALKYGHHDIAEILKNYTNKMKHIEKDLIKLSNNKVYHCYLSNNSTRLSKSETTGLTCLVTPNYNSNGINQNSCQTLEKECNHLKTPTVYHHKSFSGLACKQQNHVYKTSTKRCNSTRVQIPRPETHPSSVSLDNSVPQDINSRILAAKDELLALIEKFKSGISIRTFEHLFANWEKTYQDVLKGQISNEFLYSLNEIRKLCSMESSYDCSPLAEDEDDEEDESDDVAFNEHREFLNSSNATTV